MAEFLLFRLGGPMAAWGDVAVGEIRATWSRPSKSAVLGLVAAALGHPRTHEEALQALDENLGFAVRLDGGARTVRPFTDYHTTQTAVTKRNVRHLTRRDELNAEDLATVLSDRSYLANALATIALWRKADGAPAWPLFINALKHPHFTPYLGRKSCPLARPLAPWLVKATALAAAFAAYDANAAELESHLPPALQGQDGPIWFELGAGLTDPTTEETSRRDGLRRRRDWTFRDRREGLLRVHGGA